MKTLREVHQKMYDYNNEVAYGSEGPAWQVFCEDCFSNYGMDPWEDEEGTFEVSDDFYDYWSSVAERKNPDFDEDGNYLN